MLNNPSKLIKHILHVLYEESRHCETIPADFGSVNETSSVLFLLTYRCRNGFLPEPCIILNKRSQKVRQPGDLCCPGGGISVPLDFRLARILEMPFLPLAKWHYWSRFKDRCPEMARQMALLYAAGLREGMEEMRLNPFGIDFLGPLPPQRLSMFKKTIYPMAAWVKQQKRFYHNWEVEKIIFIPIRSLLNTENYARYRIVFGPSLEKKFDKRQSEYPCFIHKTPSETELLWGATYRIVTVFLELIFGFKPPGMLSLPVVSGTLRKRYLTGSYTPS